MSELRCLGQSLPHKPSRSSGKGRDRGPQVPRQVWDPHARLCPCSTARSSVLVNTSCRLVNLAAHLRQKAGLLPDVTLALLAEDRNLVSLEEDLKEAASGAPTRGSSLLKERATYVLVRVITRTSTQFQSQRQSRDHQASQASFILSPHATEGEGMAPTRYESLLENLDDHYPELAGEGQGTARGGAQLLPSPYQQDFSGLPEELRRLSGLSSAGHDQRKRMGTRRGHHEQSSASRSRKVSFLPPRRLLGPGARYGGDMDTQGDTQSGTPTCGPDT
ncbi:hypothetical protein AAY473_005131 [Plecturocebus cupreus]